MMLTMQFHIESGKFSPKSIFYFDTIVLIIYYKLLGLKC